jgi:hypothetical protein
VLQFQHWRRRRLSSRRNTQGRSKIQLQHQRMISIVILKKYMRLANNITYSSLVYWFRYRETHVEHSACQKNAPISVGVGILRRQNRHWCNNFCFNTWICHKVNVLELDISATRHQAIDTNIFLITRTNYFHEPEKQRRRFNHFYMFLFDFRIQLSV